MEKLKPQLLSVMKAYTKEQFVKDVIAVSFGRIAVIYVIKFFKDSLGRI